MCGDLSGDHREFDKKLDIPAIQELILIDVRLHRQHWIKATVQEHVGERDHIGEIDQRVAVQVAHPELKRTDVQATTQNAREPTLIGDTWRENDRRVTAVDARRATPKS